MSLPFEEFIADSLLLFTIQSGKEPSCGKEVTRMPVPDGIKRELDDQSRFYQEVSRLYRGPRFRKALDDLEDNSDDRQAGLDDPNAYFRNKNVDIAPDIDLRVEESSPLRVGVCFRAICVWLEW
jgi:hypothetical protein